MLKDVYGETTVWTAMGVFHDLHEERYHVQRLDNEENKTRVLTDRVPDERRF